MIEVDVHWTHEWLADGRIAFRVGRVGADFVAEWVGFATLRSDPSGSRWELKANDSVDRERVEKFHRGLANALIRHLRGELTLHGSSVALAEHAITCIGASGSGKSTAAADLCGAIIGAELVSDDSTAISLDVDAVRVLPTEDRMWLSPEALAFMGQFSEGTRKVPTIAARRAVESVPLRAIVSLTFDDSLGPALRRLGGHEAFMLLSANTFRFATDDANVHMRDLDHLAALAERVPVWELRRPRTFDKLPSSRELLLRLLTQNTAS